MAGRVGSMAALCPWPCKNAERAYTEGNLVLLAPQFPSGLANAVEDMAPKQNSVLRVLPAPAF
jgi:hypothetical protein